MDRDEWQGLAASIAMQWPGVHADGWYDDLSDLDGGAVTAVLAELGASDDLSYEPDVADLRRRVVGSSAAARAQFSEPVSTGPYLPLSAWLAQGAPTYIPREAPDHDRQACVAEIHAILGRPMAGGEAGDGEAAIREGAVA